MFKFKIMTAFSIVASFVLIMMSNVWAVENDMPVHPQTLIENATNKMVQALAENKDALEQEPNLIYGLVEDILLPNFDFNKISKLALGKKWRKADEMQKLRFVEEFRLLVIRTYSTALIEYANNDIEFIPFKGDLKKKKVKVKMEILQSGGPSISMAVAVYLNKENEWKVYDVKIDGISLVTNYRSTFANHIRKEGMEHLIDDLANSNVAIKEAQKSE